MKRIVGVKASWHRKTKSKKILAHLNMKLSVEQEFAIARFAQNVKALTREEAQAELVELYRLSIQNENLYKKFLMESLGMKPCQ
jgi:Phycobilisome degradation protein nblA